MASGTGVPVLDPVSLRPRREIDAGGEPLAVAFPAGAAWIGLRNRIQVVDRPTGRNVRSLPIPGTAYQLVAAGAVVDVVLDGALIALDTRTGRPLARRPLDSAGSLTAVLAAGALWVARLDGGRTRLGRFDPRTLAPSGTGPVFGANGVALAAVGAHLWVADHSAGTLSCLDPATGAVRTTTRVPNTSALAADTSWAYLADRGLVRRVPAAC
jgi:outer membrane protein assembly factor BamB